MKDRPIERVYYTSHFQKSLLKMPNIIQGAFLNKESILRANIFHPSLETHKLHGKYQKYWALTIIGQNRLMFEFLNTNEILLINIGTHEIYK